MNSKPANLLITENLNFSSRALATLRSHFNVVSDDLDRQGLLQAVVDTEILWIRLRHHIDETVMATAKHLHTIVTPTTGLNHIDLDAARERDITVLSLKGRTNFLKRVCATAEHTVGLILALLRRIPAATAHVRQGGWNRDEFRGGELDGKTVGIVGFGRLGQLVAGYLKPFGVTLLANDPKPMEDTGSVSLVPLEELLERSDMVTLHADYHPGNRAFFGQDAFAAMKPGGLFINTARGELVDETALLDALEGGHLAGAALDVLAGEQATGMGHHPLVQYVQENDNLIITPHMGGCTAESMSKTEEFMATLLIEQVVSNTPTPRTAV